MKTQQLTFGPYVMKTTVSQDILTRLKQDGKGKLQSHHRQLAGHLSTQLLFNEDTIAWFYNETASIWDTYRENHCQFHDIPSYRVEMGARELWINYMKAGDFNPPHTHSGDYSFVLFVDVPKSLEKEQQAFEGSASKPGALMFEYTQQARPRWATTGRTVEPRTGEMYIFPSLLQHWVAPFKSSGTRISVSGNLHIANRLELPHGYF